MKNIKTWQDVLLEITETDPADFNDRSNICISQKDLGDILKSAMDGQEVHDALCPALTGGTCTCSTCPATVDKAWSKFCGGIGRGPDAPYPGMIEAFEAHYGQSFTDKDWRNETGIWAAAWGYAVRQSATSSPVEFHTESATSGNTNSTC